MSQSSHFATTHWTVVLHAGQRSSPECQAALATLCQQYWYPLYAFARRRGHAMHAAQDLTQAFFARLLEKDDLHAADPKRGRFRSFLLAAFQNFLANDWDRQTAQKRGGGQALVSLDVRTAEERLMNEPVHDETAERLFDRRWALLVLDRALQRLRADYLKGGREAIFTALEPQLTGGAADRNESLREIGERVGMSEAAIKVAVHRLRKRFGEALREEIAQTLSTPDDTDDELRQLFAALGD
jgi:RNA polymerase sigma factor (sigma-70 family)